MNDLRKKEYDNAYMRMAEEWSKLSYAFRHKVGALIVKDNKIISDGYNGTPHGFPNECENVICNYSDSNKNCPYCNLLKPINLFKRCYNCKYAELKTKKEVLHAEANAITKLSKSNESAEGATLYVTLSPCFECAKLIIQSGITRVVYGEKYHDTSGIDLLEKANIKVELITKEEFDSKKNEIVNILPKNDIKTFERVNKLLNTDYKSNKEIDWKYISEYKKLSEDFIREFQDKVDWYYIAVYQKLSEDFIREFQDKVNWSDISRYQKLSEDFIREFQDKVDWEYISAYQKLSKDFIKEFQDKIDWYYIS